MYRAGGTSLQGRSGLAAGPKCRDGAWRRRAQGQRASTSGQGRSGGDRGDPGSETTPLHPHTDEGVVDASPRRKEPTGSESYSHGNVMSNSEDLPKLVSFFR